MRPDEHAFSSWISAATNHHHNQLYKNNSELCGVLFCFCGLLFKKIWVSFSMSYILPYLDFMWYLPFNADTHTRQIYLFIPSVSFIFFSFCMFYLFFFSLYEFWICVFVGLFLCKFCEVFLNVIFNCYIWAFLFVCLFFSYFIRLFNSTHLML